MIESDVLIIGAGISGLICATELQRAGLRVCVVDKGRGPGGRMATRRMGGGRIDHGAQFFTVRNERFRAYVREWLDAGVVREWFDHPTGNQAMADHHPRYCGVSGMSDAPKYLARELEVHCSERILRITRKMDRWIAGSETGQAFSAPEIVLTAPLPQTLTLLNETGLNYAGDDMAALRAIHYEKGLALLAILDGPSGLPEPGAIKLEDSPLAWIADNQMKGISPDSVVAITIHATPAFAEKHWDSEDAVRTPMMIDTARHWLQANVIEVQCHRWAFTRPVNPWPQQYYRNLALQLTLAGDAFGGLRIENSALSGMEAAAQIRK